MVRKLLVMVAMVGCISTVSNAEDAKHDHGIKACEGVDLNMFNVIEDSGWILGMADAISIDMFVFQATQEAYCSTVVELKLAIGSGKYDESDVKTLKSALNTMRTEHGSLYGDAQE